MVKNHSENRPNDEKYSTKLSRTLFIMIAVSLGFWLPSTVIFSVHSLCHIVRSLSAKYRPNRYRRDKSVKFGIELP